VTALARLHPEDLELLAQRTAALVLAQFDPAPRPPAGPAVSIDAAEVARRFGVDRSWVYEHANELGAIRLPSRPNAKRKGEPRPRLRFDPETVAAAIVSCQRDKRPAATETPAPPARRRRRRADRTGTGRTLLPIRGPGAAA